jgi:hypothetical protein
MALTVNTTSPYTKLVTLARVKTALGITTSTAYDSHINTVIDEASDCIRDHCGTIFRKQKYTQTQPGDGSQFLKMKRYPIVAVHSMTLRGNSVTSYIVEDRDAGLLHNETGFEWTVAAGVYTLENYPIPDGDLFKYSTVFTAGFIMPEQQSTFSATSTSAVYKNLPKCGHCVQEIGATVNHMGITYWCIPWSSCTG